MKNLNKITKYFITLFWLGLCCTTLKAEVVITEFFILQADNSHAPQYVELYNNSDAIISLENWSITTLRSNGDPLFKTFFNTNNYVDINNLEIDPFGYFLISSKWCVSTTGCNFYNANQSDIIAFYLILPFDDTAEEWPFIDKGSIIITNNNNVEEDRIDYDIAAGWPVGEESKGHSLRLHVSPNSDDNDNPDNWSLSPATENSLWLYEENTEIKNFGSPREENSFRLNGDEYFNHIISGDVNNVYNADNDYEYNNYGVPLEFSWEGTFDDKPDQQYRLIIEKTNTEKPDKHGFEIISYPDMDTTIIRENIIEINTSINPASLDIDQLEFADYSWTIELTKTYSGGVDTIYSDRHYFSVDARDYGIYGCVDTNFCKIDSGFPNCPTTADDETLFSNHPLGCIPGENCFSALNYYEDANINSSKCHYVSLSIPAFVVGDPNETVRVPVYFKNDSLAEINEIEFTLNYDYSSDIVSYTGGTILGTVLSQLNDANINAEPESDSVIISLSSARIAGIITYLDFNIIGLQGEYTDLTISEVRVNGGNPENDISVPVSGEGELVILQTDYEIWGNVVYYSGDNPYEVPNVKLKLDKNYDGDPSDTNYFEITNEYGFFEFDTLTEGNYNLSFSKESGNDCNGDYISGTDISRIARHVIGSEPFNTDQRIAADVSLDGTVSGYDASLLAQYDVGLIINFNDIETHWIFKPKDSLNVHSELLEHNGIYSIEYKPLVLDDKIRTISAYRLGDVTGNYCNDPLSRFNREQVQFINIVIDYTPIITLPIIISEPTFIEGMDIEIGYDEDVFSPHSITFNTSNIKTERYNSVSNLLSRDGSIKTVTWAIDEPQIVEGIIGEVSFNWNNKNKSGKIWLKDFQVNDEPVVGGISIIGLNDNDIADGVNIINSLVPGELSLHQNYPNPFNPQTTIKWSMPLSGIASLEVYNLQGQLVELLFNGQLDTGIHEQEWDATAYPSGIYFYRLKTHEKTLQKIMLLLK